MMIHFGGIDLLQDVYYYFDYGNEIIPRVYENIYEPIDYIREQDFEDGNGTQRIGLMEIHDGKSFALFNIFFPNEYYREYSWDQNKYILQYNFIDKEHIKLTYLLKSETLRFSSTIEDDGVLRKRSNQYSDYFININDKRRVRVKREGMLYEYENYLKYEIIDLESYISTKSTIEDYHYQFITSAKVSENVTKETFNLLHTHWMNKGDVNQIFNTQGIFVKQYSCNGKDYEIYGYLGGEAAVFAIFNEDLLIACEYLNLNHYNEH